MSLVLVAENGAQAPDLILRVDVYKRYTMYGAERKFFHTTFGLNDPAWKRSEKVRTRA